MTYEQRSLRRQRVRSAHANADNPLVYQLVIDGAKVTPTSATITIYRSGSTTALVTAAAMVVGGTKLTYSVDTTTAASWPIETGYRADILVTVAGVVYQRHLLFDVVFRLFDLNIGVDQLVALDDGIRGMAWDGDEDFSAAILACSDVLQAKIESKILGTGRLLQEQVIDPTRLAQAARFYMLGHIYRTKGNSERAGQYMAEYREIWDALLSSERFDKGQDGSEDGEPGDAQEVRIVT